MNEAYAQLVQMTKMLKNLRQWLEAGVELAGAKKFEPEVLLNARLAPDMYTLTQQVQSACDGVKLIAARLTGTQPPSHPDTEKTLDEVRARIDKVISYVEGFKPEQFEGWQERTVTMAFLPGKGMKAEDWLHEMNLPNTYFHITTAYAILRHNGVPLGKTPFIGSLTLHDV
jgi:hypothetical protein